MMILILNSNSSYLSCTLYKFDKWWKETLTAADLETFSANECFVFDVLGLEGKSNKQL
jgi:hypothetical protein